MQIVNTENIDSFNSLVQQRSCIMQCVLCDVVQHINNNDVLCLFFKFIGNSEIYIYPVNTLDCENMDLHECLNQLKCSKLNKYILDKKQLLNIESIPNLIDIDLVSYFEDGSVIEKEQFNTTIHDKFYMKYKHSKNANVIIPLMKHLEFFDEFSEYIKNIYDSPELKTPVFNKFNNNLISVLSLIERNGMCVNPDKLIEKYGQSVSRHIKNNLVYSNYNIYTLTGRPSNSFGGINFSALNSEDITRECFISRYGNDGKLVYLDYESYHFRLLSAILDYHFPLDTKVHDILGGDKSENFHKLYGGPKDTDKHPFWKKVKEFTKSVWFEFKENDYIESLGYGKKIKRSHIGETNPYKLMNYLVQLFETEQNCETLKSLHKYCHNKEIKIVQYIYDGIVFDVHKDEDYSELVEIMKNDNQFPLTVKVGDNLKF